MISRIAITNLKVLKNILIPMDNSPEMERLLELIASEEVFEVLVDLKDEVQCREVLKKLGL